jgi:hypothetical protein
MDKTGGFKPSTAVVSVSANSPCIVESTATTRAAVIFCPPECGVASCMPLSDELGNAALHVTLQRNHEASRGDKRGGSDAMAG